MPPCGWVRSPAGTFLPFQCSWESSVDVEPDSFVMNAHGLNSFVLYFCGPCGAGRDPAPTYGPPLTIATRPRHTLPPLASPQPHNSLQTLAACFQGSSNVAWQKSSVFVSCIYKCVEMKQHSEGAMQQQHMLEWMLLSHICFEWSSWTKASESQLRVFLLLQWLVCRCMDSQVVISLSWCLLGFSCQPQLLTECCSFDCCLTHGALPFNASVFIIAFQQRSVWANSCNMLRWTLFFHNTVFSPGSFISHLCCHFF